MIVFGGVEPIGVPNSQRATPGNSPEGATILRVDGTTGDRAAAHHGYANAAGGDQPTRGGWKIEEARRTGNGEMKSQSRDDAQSGCATAPTIGTSSLPCEPKVGTGAGGTAGRFGAPEQFGPEHGFWGSEGSLAVLGGGARSSGVEMRVLKTVVEWFPHPAVARSEEAHTATTSSRVARQPRVRGGREITIRTTEDGIILL